MILSRQWLQICQKMVVAAGLKGQVTVPLTPNVQKTAAKIMKGRKTAAQIMKGQVTAAQIMKGQATTAQITKGQVITAQILKDQEIAAQIPKDQEIAAGQGRKGRETAVARIIPAQTAILLGECQWELAMYPGSNGNAPTAWRTDFARVQFSHP